MIDFRALLGYDPPECGEPHPKSGKIFVCYERECPLCQKNPDILFTEGIRADCYDPSSKRRVNLTIAREIRYNEEAIYIRHGGVTDHESWFIRNIVSMKDRKDAGFYACAGTKGRWDSLYLPDETVREMIKHFEKFV